MNNIYYDHETILKDIIQTYGKIQFDCTFNKGTMWLGLQRDLWPEIKGDIIPLFDFVKKINIENSLLDPESIKSIIYDPPFIIKNTNKPNKMMIRYGYFLTAERLFNHLNNSLLEISRILIKKGILVVKIQDVITGSQKYFSHIMIANKAREYNLELIDICIKNNIYLPSGPNFTYWMIFKKNSRTIRIPKF